MRPPNGAALFSVSTAIEMHHAVEQATLGADALIMAAAVADFRPETRSQQKLKKTAGQEYLDIRLVRNPDILASIDPPKSAQNRFRRRNRRSPGERRAKARRQGSRL